MLSQIIQSLQIYRVLLLILLIPIFIFPVAPFIATYIFRPLENLTKMLNKNYSYFFVYDFINKKPICCALIYIITQDNKKFLTITDKHGLAYFLPKNKHKSFVKVYHPFYKIPDFNTIQIKDNVFIKKIPNSYIYLSPESGIAFPLIKKSSLTIHFVILIFKIISFIYFSLFTIFYFWTLFLLLNNITIFNFTLFLLISIIYKTYIQTILQKNRDIYPRRQIAKPPFIIKNVLNNQDVAIIHKSKIPIVLEKGHYQVQINNISIPLKIKKLGALYFVKDKA